MKVIKSLIDPSMPELRTMPRNERDLMIAAENSWLLVFDNISSIPVWLSDAMCRLATGGGFSTRALYQDAEEKRFDVKRPQAMTAIGEVIVRPDLLDRSIELSAPPIQANARREESRLWSEFETVKPLLLGTLFDAVACSLNNRNSIRLSELPRMADYAIAATAAEPAFGVRGGTFMAAYQRNRRQADQVALDASLVAQHLFDSKFPSPFSGTWFELLDTLNQLANPTFRRHRAWPKTPRALSAELRRIQPNLAAVGFQVEFERETTTRTRRRLVHIIRPPDLVRADNSQSQMQARRGEMEIDNWDQVVIRNGDGSPVDHD